MTAVRTHLEARDLCGPGGILTLDLAGRTGWAYGQVGGDPAWGFEIFGREGAAAGAIFTRFQEWLQAGLHILAPRRVYAELAFVGPYRNAVMRLAGYKAYCQGVCFAEDRALRFVAPKEITALFTGRGHWPKGTKKAATIAVCELYGWHVGNDDDAADALALFVYGEQDLSVAAGDARTKALIALKASKNT